MNNEKVKALSLFSPILLLERFNISKVWLVCKAWAKAIAPSFPIWLLERHNILRVWLVCKARAKAIAPSFSIFFYHKDLIIQRLYFVVSLELK